MNLPKRLIENAKEMRFYKAQAINECKFCIGMCIIVLEQQIYFQGTLDTFSQIYI